MTDVITPEFYSKIRGIAYSRCRMRGRLDLFEDAAQEGAIRAWQSSQKESLTGDRHSYMLVAAVNGILQVLRGNPMTGEERTSRSRNDATWMVDDIDDDVFQDVGGSYEDPDPFGNETYEAIAACLSKRDKFIFVARFAWGESWPWVGANVPGKKLHWKTVAAHWHKEVWPWIKEQVALAA